MPKIKAIFRNISEEKKATFKNSQCLLTISVGQETHEGELFDITIELINKSFASCIILVDDSLQRHTMALNSNKDANYFYEVAIKEGDLWLERNKQYYNKLTIPSKILRWNKWLHHTNFQTQQTVIKKLIETDLTYKAAFEHSIKKFIEKYYERLANPENFDKERAWQLSLDFVIEECTVLCLWTELECHFEVYPSLRNEAMDETHKRFVLPNHPNLLHPVGIKFKNAKQMKPQCFELL